MSVAKPPIADAAVPNRLGLGVDDIPIIGLGPKSKSSRALGVSNFGTKDLSGTVQGFIKDRLMKIKRLNYFGQTEYFI